MRLVDTNAREAPVSCLLRTDWETMSSTQMFGLPRFVQPLKADKVKIFGLLFVTVPGSVLPASLGSKRFAGAFTERSSHFQ